MRFSFTRWLLLISSALLGIACTDSHALDPDAAVVSDAPASPDAPPDAAPAPCRLEDLPTSPTAVGEGCFCDAPIAVRGSTLYRLSFALEVVDLADPAHPRLVTSVPHEARFSADAAIVGDVLFAAGGPLDRFDLTSPLAPVSLGVLDVGGETVALAADGSRLVVAIRRADMTHAIVSIDATNPRAPVVGTPIDMGMAQPLALALAGTTAFAVTQDVGTGASSLVTLDLTGARILDTLPRGMGSSLAALVVHEAHVFISDLSDGVALVDATDPSALTDLGMLDLEPTVAFALAGEGDRLVVLGGGVWLYDISSPRTPVPLGHAMWGFDLGHAELYGETVVASGGNSLVALPLTCD